MKRLQNNYTTPEQSKRLLELGVPAWTADCYYKESGKIEIKNTALDTLYPSCWSVGRLIEIYHICVGPGCSFTFHVCFPNLMNEIIYKIAEAKSNRWLNLEKLEE
jgi:hypothetical protein